MPTLPEWIGPYQVRALLGRGGMAAVYQAYQPSLDRVVALKVMSAHLAAEPEFLERFRQEAWVIAKLVHPNIVTVHDAGEERGSPYLVMEYVDGRTLADLLDEDLPLERVPGILRQVAAGLDYAHARGVVHRDIKPRNVLLTHDGRAVLADFGLARILESVQRLTMAGGVVGTPEYMSPEQAGGRVSDHRADVYALGVLLYEMVAGIRPFTAETPLGVLMKQVSDAPLPPGQVRAGLPAGLDAILARALAKHPEERYQSAGALARAFSAVMGAEEAPPEPRDQSVPAVTHGEVPRTETPPATPEAAARAAAPSPPATPDPRTATAECAQVTESVVCPSCGAGIPGEATICPACTYMLPFAQVAPRAARPPLQRKQMRINLLPYGLRWDASGLSRARQVVEQSVASFINDEWELVTSLESAGTFVQGRGAAGPVIQAARLTLQRRP